jgi:hypothetical protein
MHSARVGHEHSDIDNKITTTQVDLTPSGTYKVTAMESIWAISSHLKKLWLAARVRFGGEEHNWEAYLLIEPDRDLDNDVAIRLTGVGAQSLLYSKVDLQHGTG